MALIAILTPALSSWDPAYSLCHVISDQVKCLTKHGHFVSVIVSEQFRGEGPKGALVWECLPSEARADITEATIEALRICLSQVDVVFTHDWTSRLRMLPYYEGMRLFAQGDDKRDWYHWTHSVPCFRYDHWDFEVLPSNHFLVYPNNTDTPVLAAQFRTSIDRVKVIPHICDLRSLLDFSPDAQKIVEAVPGLVNAEFVQVYPAAADRLKDKGLDHIVQVCGAIRNEGHSVCCLVIDSWTRRKPKRDKLPYKHAASLAGMQEGELVFTSDIIPDFRGLDRTDIFKLMLFSNMFMFPTYGEAFGLCMTEAMLAGAYPVPNGSIPSLREVSSGHGYFPRFIAAKRLPRTSYEQCAKEIIERVQKDVAIAGKDSIRRTLNTDIIYRDFYKPLLERKCE